MDWFDIPYSQVKEVEIAIAKGILRYLEHDLPLRERLQNWPHDVRLHPMCERLWDDMDAGRWLANRGVGQWVDNYWLYGVFSAIIYLKYGRFEVQKGDFTD